MAIEITEAMFSDHACMYVLTEGEELIIILILVLRQLFLPRVLFLLWPIWT